MNEFLLTLSLVSLVSTQAFSDPAKGKLHCLSVTDDGERFEATVAFDDIYSAEIQSVTIKEKTSERESTVTFQGFERCEPDEGPAKFLHKNVSCYGKKYKIALFEFAGNGFFGGEIIIEGRNILRPISPVAFGRFANGSLEGQAGPIVSGCDYIKD